MSSSARDWGNLGDGAVNFFPGDGAGIIKASSPLKLTPPRPSYPQSHAEDEP
jgi:hypothetical protein